MKTILSIFLLSIIIFVGFRCKMSTDFGDLRTEPDKDIITEISGTIKFASNGNPVHLAVVQLMDYNSLYSEPKLRATDTTHPDGIYHIVYESKEGYCFGGFIDLRLEVLHGDSSDLKYSKEIECSHTPIKLDIKI